MSCPFYGRCASPLLQTITVTGGNQCALIVESVPMSQRRCVMEREGRQPSWELCRAHELPMYAERAEMFLEWAKRDGGEKLLIQFDYPG